MNTFAANLNNLSQMSYTENGAVKYTTTNSKLYDLFAFGGAYRERTVSEKNKLFDDAWNENAVLALKCLFYLRDVRGGQGERIFFRQVLSHFIEERKLNDYQMMYIISLIPEYGRWDDVIYLYDHCTSKSLRAEICTFIYNQLLSDDLTDYPSLLAKWMPSETASDKNQKRLAATFAKKFNLSKKNYRKLLSRLRTKINIVEKLMSENKWEEIEFDKLPSKAGLRYSKAFHRNAEERYQEFINNKHTKVNSGTLYPYEITTKLHNYMTIDEFEPLQKYWDNLPNYIPEGKSAICVCDVSGSMMGRPIEVSTSLSIYCAERLKGDFHNLFITFSEYPQIQKLEGNNIFEKYFNLKRAEWGYNTNLEKVFDLLHEVAINSNREDIPDTVIIISDMEIDAGCRQRKPLETTMQSIMSQWKHDGLKIPHLVYWNVDARHNTVLDRGENITCVSGFSASTFEMILGDKSGIDVMLDKLNSERYNKIKIK